MVDMRRAGNFTIDLGGFGISVVMAGTRATGVPAPQQARAVDPESRSMKARRPWGRR